MKSVLRALGLAILFSPVFSFGQKSSDAILRTKEYILYPDRIVQQNKYSARALSPTELSSDYKSPANQFKSAHINFKFSINGKDNEMASGTDHHFYCESKNGACETPIIKFGEQLKENPDKNGNKYLPSNTRFKLRVDLSAVFSAFAKQGYYTNFKGDKIYREDFKGVYVAGNTPPLIWDFDNLVNHPQLQLKDEDNDHVYERTLILNAPEGERTTETHWKLSKDISDLPQYYSTYPISDALYNMALEEMSKAIEPDSTFRTGKEWAGVWTRDISYSIILSMAYLQPQVAMKSLMRKVNKKGRIIQDTGTGGAYPCSTDRIIWAVAAWEVYLATGNEYWLKQIYEIIRNSIDDDLQVVYDSETGLVKGESSFLDWREETYPGWMQPADIFESECLGTNAIHFKGNLVLAQMASMMGEKDIAEKHKAIAKKIKEGINKYLWMPNKGYYAQYLYGRNYKVVSPRAEALGEALCVLWDIADREKQKQIVAKTPVTDFGITCIFPQIPNIPPYHNNAVWPFVQSFWLRAAARAGNESSVLKSIGDIYRPAAMFLTNKENFVAQNGDYNGTQINSSNMLWSLSGNISIIHKIIFGIRFNPEGLSFEPFVPKAMAGKRNLSNFKYRNAIFNIVMEGYGNEIASFSLDGRKLTQASIPASLRGIHTIRIRLANNSTGSGAINEQPAYFSPETPATQLKDNLIRWLPIKNAISYIVLKNGTEIGRTKQNTFTIDPTLVAEYQVIAIDSQKKSSFASEPLLCGADNLISKLQAEAYYPKANYPGKGFLGDGFVETDKSVNEKIEMPLEISDSGMYSIDFRYANGNGPTNTDNKCALRSLKIDGIYKGTIVLPQRGTNEWSNWGFSNPLKVYLKKGKHLVQLVLEDFDDNMNGKVNQAMLDYIRIIRIRE